MKDYFSGPALAAPLPYPEKRFLLDVFDDVVF